jgi:hypothetical protein
MSSFIWTLLDKCVKRSSISTTTTIIHGQNVVSLVSGDATACHYWKKSRAFLSLCWLVIRVQTALTALQLLIIQNLYPLTHYLPTDSKTFCYLVMHLNLTIHVAYNTMNTQTIYSTFALTSITNGKYWHEKCFCKYNQFVR